MSFRISIIQDRSGGLLTLSIHVDYVSNKITHRVG